LWMLLRCSAAYLKVLPLNSGRKVGRRKCKNKRSAGRPKNRLRHRYKADSSPLSHSISLKYFNNPPLVSMWYFSSFSMHLRQSAHQCRATDYLGKHCKKFYSKRITHGAGIATSYGLDNREVGVRVPVRSRILSSPSRPDRLWSPPSLLSNG
jgi:hypothetical protein